MRRKTLRRVAALSLAAVCFAVGAGSLEAGIPDSGGATYSQVAKAYSAALQGFVGGVSWAVTGIWFKAGAGMDPNGYRTRAGAGMDPNGVSTRAGAGMDPNGVSTRAGAGMDPNG